MRKILFVASEALPFAATGGLGDVIGSLPAALVKKGEDCRVIMPLYSMIRPEYREKMEFLGKIEVPLAWRKLYCGIFKMVYNEVVFYFLDNEFYFKRTSMYGSFDDGERYAFFSRAVMDAMQAIDFYPDILHTNDWQSALCVVYLKRKYIFDPRYAGIKSVHTIHNIDYQGIYDFRLLGDVFDLSPEDASVVEYGGAVNLTKGAIVCCDMLTTVSPRYALEIQTEHYASGLHYIINDHRGKVTGILNGIDTQYYNPALDSEIYKRFDSESLDIKAENKAELQKSLELPVCADVPMIAMITRLTAHKGLDLVTCVAGDLLKGNVQLVILGTGDRHYEEFFTDLEQRYPEKVRAVIRFDKTLSKQIYASADLFLMPSKSEPCGLAQMIASRYGTVPIVRETGGLYDSIKYYAEQTGEGNGFTFANFNAHDMLYTIFYACDIYTHKKDAWTALVKKIMNIDFSWNVSAGEYRRLYDRVCVQ